MTGQPGERRLQILQTLAAMLETPQGEKITTAALAARLQCSEAALYRHFASKAQMFEGLIEFIEQTVFTLVNRIQADEKGIPNPVERAFVIPPGSRLGPLTPEERRKVIDASLLAGHYEKTVDRESAYEKLQARAAPQAAGASTGGFDEILGKIGFPQGGGNAAGGRGRETAIEAAAKSAARAIGSEVGRRVIRGVLGSIFGGRR